MYARFCLQVLCKRPAFRRVVARNSTSFPTGFTLFPKFLDAQEQRILLTSALCRLDALESKRVRKLQKQHRLVHPPSNEASTEDLFLPENCYTFQKGHYDNVIRDYREMHLTSWRESEIPGLAQILNRLYTLCPSGNTQTHILHLASTGEILPHTDNPNSSGTWILAVSLGATRVLHLEGTSAATPPKIDVPLMSGSVYLQRDDVRYHWKHAVVHPHPSPDHINGQRVSIIIRVCFEPPSPSSSLNVVQDRKEP
ncbi:hypothetical protein ID866_4633 [Astraeus odoratus]|nr:hypothetical protein ID866_4633 [Astraeus odoratus]